MGFSGKIAIIDIIWARLDGPDTRALLPEVVIVVCSRVPRAEAWDRFEVCCCCCAVVEDDIDTFAAAAAAAVGNHATCLYPLKYRVCRCRDQGIFAFYGG